MRKSALFAFAPVAAAIAVAGCGGSGGESSHSSTARGEAGGAAVPTIVLPPSMFGKIPVEKRTDGIIEVTYNGHPRYYFASDPRAGEITGQAISEVGAPEYILTVNGAAAHGG
jgi:Secreted repeat of unknown function